MTLTAGLRTSLRSTLRSGLNPSDASDPAAPTWQAVGTVERGTGALTPTWPTHAANDIAYLTVVNLHTASMAAATLGTASGFAAVTGGSAETATISGLVARITVFWCRASGGAQAAPVTTAQGSWSNAWITTVRGAISSGDPTDDVQTAVQDALDTSLSMTGADTTGANRLVLVLAGAITSGDIVGLDSGANATLTGFTEQLDDQALSGTERTHAAVFTGTKATTGNTGTTTATYNATYAVWAGLTVAVKAA